MPTHVETLRIRLVASLTLPRPFGRFSRWHRLACTENVADRRLDRRKEFDRSLMRRPVQRHHLWRMPTRPGKCHRLHRDQRLPPANATAARSLTYLPLHESVTYPKKLPSQYDGESEQYRPRRRQEPIPRRVVCAMRTDRCRPQQPSASCCTRDHQELRVAFSEAVAPKMTVELLERRSPFSASLFVQRPARRWRRYLHTAQCTKLSSGRFWPIPDIDEATTPG
jgi:hypothetical protein